VQVDATAVERQVLTAQRTFAREAKSQREREYLVQLQMVEAQLQERARRFTDYQ
jgi:hypothetical protein